MREGAPSSGFGMIDSKKRVGDMFLARKKNGRKKGKAENIYCEWQIK